MPAPTVSYEEYLSAKRRMKALEQVVIAFINRVALRSGRWPCPECGRKNSEADLKGLTVITEEGKEMFVGCWRCDLEDILLRSATALKMPEGSL